MRYLSVDILRGTMGDCTNNGVTSVAKCFRENTQFVIQCNDGPITQEDVDRAGYVVLVAGEAGGRMHLKPMEDTWPTCYKWYMFGGNFAYSSDSRFSRLNNGCPIHIHDRTES